MLRHLSILSIVLCAELSVAAEPRDYPVVPVPATSVELTGGLWKARFDTNRDVTVRHVFKQCEETGRIRNFEIAAGQADGDYQGYFFNDSDVFKAVEGAAYALAHAPDPELDAYVDKLIATFAAAQEDDGYLYTIRTIRGEDINCEPCGPTRWSSVRWSHELYNAGHLYEAAVAHFQATGKRTLLDIALKNAELVDHVFGPQPGQLRDVPGHPEIELALVRLYRLTGEQRYLDLARFFIDQRGRHAGRASQETYAQDHAPVVEQDEAVGHAVRAQYLYCGMADVAALTGSQAYLRALDRLWADVVGRKLYITGGVGATSSGEALGAAYELPNETAYAETCASIAHMMWNHRMFLLYGDARYMDVFERVLYNGFLSGVSLAGDAFFYVNPLACDGKRKFNHGVVGRSAWFQCACCPPNVVRMMPSIPGYVYAATDDALYVNLYTSCRATLAVAETNVRLTQETQYPWEGRVRLTIAPETATRFALRLRVPGWAQNKPLPSDLYRYLDPATDEPILRVNGEPVPLTLEKGYAVVERTWKAGDTVELELPLAPRRVLAHERITDNVGRVAIECGPVVYCAEAVDHGGSVADLILPDSTPLRVRHEADLFGGVNVIEADAERLVRTQGASEPAPARLKAIPYYAWAHREIGPMAVWIARQAAAATPSSDKVAR